MPLFAEEASPLYAPSKNEVAQRWQKKVGEFDAFIVTAAEYNRGPTAVLKNALDYAYAEWSNKPVAFVGYGVLAVIKDGKPLSELEHLNQAARQMLDQMAWWTAALKAAREKSLREAA